MARSTGGRSTGGSRSSGGLTSGGRSSLNSPSSRSRSTGPASRSITTPTRSTPSRSHTPFTQRIPSTPRSISRSRQSSGNPFTDGMAMSVGMELGRRIVSGNRNSSRGMGGRPSGMNGYSGSYRSSNFSNIFAVIIIVIIVAVFASALAGSGGDIPVSTIKREALPKDVANTDAPAILYDGLEWVANKSEVMKGVNDFYSQTGIWPMIYITDSIGGEVKTADYFRQNYHLVESYLSELFGEVENNSGNMLVFIFDDGEDWDIWLQSGTQAVTIMDSEASKIFVGYMDRYWYSDRETETMLKDIFSDSATRIMQVTRPWWHVPLVVTLVGGTILIVGLIGFKFYSRRKDAEAREMENTERVLSTSLGDLEDEASRLAEQYED